MARHPHFVGTLPYGLELITLRDSPCGRRASALALTFSTVHKIQMGIAKASLCRTISARKIAAVELLMLQYIIAA